MGSQVRYDPEYERRLQDRRNIDASENVRLLCALPSGGTATFAVKTLTTFGPLVSIPAEQILEKLQTDEIITSIQIFYNSKKLASFKSAKICHTRPFEDVILLGLSFFEEEGKTTPGPEERRALHRAGIHSGL